jgi:hypothetical protein
VTERRARPVWIVAVLLLGSVIIAVGKLHRAYGDNESARPEFAPVSASLVEPPRDGSCRTVTVVLDQMERLAIRAVYPGEPPDCSFDPGITDWIMVEDSPQNRYFGFDAAGCFVDWQVSRDATCP